MQARFPARWVALGFNFPSTGTHVRSLALASNFISGRHPKFKTPTPPLDCLILMCEVSIITAATSRCRCSCAAMIDEPGCWWSSRPPPSWCRRYNLLGNGAT